MFDLALNNGTVVDPVDGLTEASIGVRDGKIEKISSLPLEGVKVIDAAGYHVCPGFIDIHMHEVLLNEGEIDPGGLNSSLLMGVTTCVGGNCGLGPASISSYRSVVENKGSPVNFIGLMGHASLREAVGCSNRYAPAAPRQVEKMKDLLRVGLDAGFAGLSSGLEYTPGATTEELLSLSRVVAEYRDRLVAVHYRFDADRSLEAVAELIIIGRESGARMQISHLGSGTAFGDMDASLRMIDSAIRGGVDLGFDVYPYDAFCSLIGSAVFDEGCLERWGVNYSALQVVEGKYSGERCTEEIFNFKRKEEPSSMIVAFVMNEDEVITAMKHPLAIIASDGRLVGSQGHPRSAGTFPRVLGRYVRQGKHLELIEAVSKMTLKPAERLSLEARGRIAEGFYADFTVVDCKNVIDRATYEEPAAVPEGIEHVVVNGVEAARKGELLGVKPGEFLSSCR